MYTISLFRNVVDSLGDVFNIARCDTLRSEVVGLEESKSQVSESKALLTAIEIRPSAVQYTWCLFLISIT